MRSCIVFAIFLTSVVSFTLAAEQPASLRPVPGDAQDLVLLLDSRPYLVRLHLQINGRSFRSTWDESIANLFRFLDADGDGVLSKQEAASAPSKTQWVQLMTGMVVEPDAAPEFAELAGDGKTANVNSSYFARYYRHCGCGALQIEWARRPGPDSLTAALFSHLDKNKDGRLSREELSAAEAALHPLDADGDDAISARELAPISNLAVLQFRTSTENKKAPDGFPFTVPENAAEPAGGSMHQPDLDLLASLEKGARTSVLVLPAADGKPNRLTAELPSSRDGALRIPLPGHQLEVARDAFETKLNKQLLKQFEELAGKGGILDEKKVYQPPFTFVAMLRLADRNGDNRLSQKELADYLDLQEKFLFRATSLIVVDRGKSLFELLDGDHDGRLSPRELRTAEKRLSPWERDNKGIERGQVPRQFQLVLNYGQSRAGLPEPQQGFADLRLHRDRSRGPLWFRKMDRNNDGDVSQREFLGTSEQFRCIDSDGDGLIDVREAERADKEFRKG